MKKLLFKPLKAFAWYAFVVLVCSIPAYYLIVDLIWVHEINEHNRIVAESVKQNLRKQHFNDAELEKSIVLWNKLQPETQIRPARQLLRDSTYGDYRKNRYIPQRLPDRYQGLVTYFELNGKYYQVTVESNVEESYETILAITAITIVFFVILITGLILLNRRISAKLWSPFYQTLAKVKAFDLSSEVAAEFEATDIEEFAEMNSSIAKLIEGNIAIFRQQKEFTENASHELQTPLAIVQSKLDLLLQSEQLSSEQSVLIESARKALHRMSRINRNLLMLAKIENQQYADVAPADLSLLLSDSIALLDDFLHTADISLESRIDQGLVVHANSQLLESMLTNLLMNAIAHNRPGGRLEVSLRDRQLVIANSGESALRAEGLFKRFGLVATGKPSTGLGLAIVREICNRYGWKADYSFENGMHIFSITF